MGTALRKNNLFFLNMNFKPKNIRENVKHTNV